MSGERPRKVAEAIQRFLSTHLASLRDPRLGFSTVTGVEISRDLKNARVFVTFHEQDEARRRAAVKALNGAAGLMRRELGRALRLRYAPSLLFQEDLSIERADRIEQLIRTIHVDEPGDESSSDEAWDESGGDESE